MGDDAKEFKKLLIDLDLEAQEIGAAVGISGWAVTLYFRGDLRAPDRRLAIKQYLARRAEEKGIDLPEFWPDVMAA